MISKPRRSRLPASIQRALVRCFIAGTPARLAAPLCGVHRHTATLFYHKLRLLITERLAAELPAPFAGEIEVDESYFGGRRKGKRGRGAAGKVAVFGLLQRGGRVYAVPVRNIRGRQTLLPIMRERVVPDSLIYSDTYPSYDVLDVSEFRHERINHKEAFAKKRNHINGIENFWSQAKRHLRHYNGVPRKHFILYLKECEWRFNYRPAERLYRTLLDWARLTEPMPRQHR